MLFHPEAHPFSPPRVHHTHIRRRQGLWLTNEALCYGEQPQVSQPIGYRAIIRSQGPAPGLLPNPWLSPHVSKPLQRHCCREPMID